MSRNDANADRNRRLKILAALSPLMVLLIWFAWNFDSSGDKPPQTNAVARYVNVFDERWIDHYTWLENDGPAAWEWAHEQNTFTMSRLDRDGTLDDFVDRITRVVPDTIPAEQPIYTRGDDLLLWKPNVSGDVSHLYWRSDRTDQRMLDPAVEARRSGPLKQSFFLFASSVLTWGPAGRFIGFDVRVDDQPEPTLRIKDTIEDQRRTWDLPPAFYMDATFLPNDPAVVYSSVGDDGSRVVLRPLDGSDSETTLFGPTMLHLEPLASPTGRYLLVTEGTEWKADRLLLREMAGEDSLRTIWADDRTSMSAQWSGPDELLGITTERAPRGKVVRLRCDRPRAAWETVIDEQPETIVGAHSSRHGIFVHANRDGQSVLRRYDATGEPLGDIALPGAGAIEDVVAHWDSPWVVVTFSSLGRSAEQFVWSEDEGRLVNWIGSAESPRDEVRLRRVSVPGPHGDVLVLVAGDDDAEGPRPTLMRVYGGYGTHSLPAYDPLAFHWIQSGGVYAIACVRGGGVYGADWHAAGSGENKPHAIDDLIAAAEGVIARGTTSSDRLAIVGGSHGGMIVAAATNRRPDLFRAVVCENALLDASDGIHAEYGSTSVRRGYSPYHNIDFGAPYPAALFVTGAEDYITDPRQSMKMVARLRAATSSNRPIYFWMHLGSGHSVNSAHQLVVQDALIASFLFHELGMN